MSGSTRSLPDTEGDSVHQPQSTCDSQLELEWQMARHTARSHSPALSLGPYIELDDVLDEPLVGVSDWSTDQIGRSKVDRISKVIEAQILKAEEALQLVGSFWQDQLLQQGQRIMLDMRDAALNIRTRRTNEDSTNDTKVIDNILQRLDGIEKSLYRHEASCALCSGLVTANSCSSIPKNDCTPDEFLEPNHITEPPSISAQDDASNDRTPQTAPKQSRAVVISFIPRELTLDRLHQLIRGGPVEQIVYDDGDSTAVVWFLSFRAAQACLEYASRYDVIVEGARLQWETCQNDLAFLPPEKEVLDALNDGLSTTICVANSDFSVETVRSDFAVYGTIVRCRRLPSGTIRIIFRAIHCALEAKLAISRAEAYAVAKVRFKKDECANSFRESKFLRQCSTRRKVQNDMTSRQLDDDDGATADAPKRRRSLSQSSDCSLDTPAQSMSRDEVADERFDRMLEAENNNREKLAQGRGQDRRRSQRLRRQSGTVTNAPRDPCKVCGTYHWFTGPRKTPCAPRYGSSTRGSRSRSGYY